MKGTLDERRKHALCSKNICFQFQGNSLFFFVVECSTRKSSVQAGLFPCAAKKFEVVQYLMPHWRKVLLQQYTLINDCDIESKMQHKEDFSQR